MLGFPGLVALACSFMPPQQAHTTSGMNFTYKDGELRVVLVGEEAAAVRITYIPKGADEDFLRYQGYVNASGLDTDASFIVTEHSGHTVRLSIVRSFGRRFG
jgi:hypothetical protein